MILAHSVCNKLGSQEFAELKCFQLYDVPLRLEGSGYGWIPAPLFYVDVLSMLFALPRGRGAVTL